MTGIRDRMPLLKYSYLFEGHSHMSVNVGQIQNGLFRGCREMFIATKITKTKYSLPWIDATIKRIMKRRQELNLPARKANDPDVKNHYIRNGSEYMLRR